MRGEVLEPVDVFHQVGAYASPHWIEDEIDALSSRHLGRWDEITVTRYQDNLVDEPVVREQGNVESQLHIDALLPKGNPEVLLLEVGNTDGAAAEQLDFTGIELEMDAAIGKAPQPERKLALLLQLIEERVGPSQSPAFPEIDISLRKRMVNDLLNGRAIVVQHAVELTFLLPVGFVQVFEYVPVQLVGACFGALFAP